MLFKKKDKRYKFNIFTLLFFLMPVIIAFVIILISGLKNGFFALPGIKWNDEAVYLKLIETCLKTGQPDGYYGFNGNHAIVGTGSAWSPAILWPLAIWGIIIKPGTSFVFIVNLFYIVAANVCFYLLVKPNTKKQVRLILTQATSAVLIMYLCTNMSEIFRFSLAIVLAGIFYNMFFTDSNKLIKYVIAPILVVGAVQVYTFFAFAIPIYIYALRKGKNKCITFVIALFSTMGVAGGSYYLLHLISSNYNIGKTESLLAALSGGQPAAAVKSAIGMFKDGVWGILSLKDYFMTYPLYPYHVLLLIVIALAGVLLFWPVLGKKEKKISNSDRTDATIGVIVFYSIAIYMVMYMTLYTIVPDTFTRGTEIVVIFSMYLCAMTDRKAVMNWLLIAQLFGLFFMKPNMEYFLTDRFMPQSEITEWKALDEKFGEAFTIDSNDSVWDRTVAMYTMEPAVICAVPEKLGLNFVMDETVWVEDAGYLLLTVKDKTSFNPEWIEKDYETVIAGHEENLKENYIEIYKDDKYVIYRKIN